jgi:hypothetical protein
VFVYCETPYEVNPEAAKLADCVSGPARNFTAVGKGRRDLGTRPAFDSFTERVYGDDVCPCKFLFPTTSPFIFAEEQDVMANMKEDRRKTAFITGYICYAM